MEGLKEAFNRNKRKAEADTAPPEGIKRKRVLNIQEEKDKIISQNLQQDLEDDAELVKLVDEMLEEAVKPVDRSG